MGDWRLHPPFLPPQQTVEKSLYLNYYYKHCMHRLMAPLMAQTTGDTVSKGRYVAIGVRREEVLYNLNLVFATSQQLWLSAYR